MMLTYFVKNILNNGQQMNITDQRNAYVRCLRQDERGGQPRLPEDRRRVVGNQVWQTLKERCWAGHIKRTQFPFRSA
jgi:hypothetical protein